MNKNFWERINRLEELASRATPGRWAYGLEAEKLGAIYPDSNRVYANLHGHDEPAGILVTVNHNLKLSDLTAEYIAAANPAMIKEMIAELKRLEKEADWLVELCQSVCELSEYVPCKKKCPLSCTCSDYPCLSKHQKTDVATCYKDWREAAHKAVEQQNERK